MVDYRREFDDVGEDVVEWVNGNFVDVEYVLDSRGELKRVCLQRVAGGPEVWFCIDGSGRVEVVVDGSTRDVFTHGNARLVFDALSDFVQSLVCT